MEDHKILIFSQFLGSLNAMADFCRQQHWDYSFITGSTSDREEQIRRFQEEEDVRVFLLSLKAGGVGINLNRRRLRRPLRPLVGTPPPNARP